MADTVEIAITQQVIEVTVADPITGDVQVTVSEQPIQIDITGGMGLPGIQGPEGPQGPQGIPGASNSSYVHNQLDPSDTWTIVHNLQMYPNIVVIDSAGSVVEGDRQYTDNNTVVLTFSGAFSGVAYLS